MQKNRQDKYSSPIQATLTGIMDLFRKEKPSGQLKPSDRLEGKTVLIDGASSGLGHATAIGLARLGARVIMACRTGIPEKGEAVRKKSGSRDVYMIPVDLLDIDSIRELAGIVKDKFAPIDILILNAGVVPRKGRQTKYGLEEMFMVNYLAKFIFINLLLEYGCLRTDGSSAPRIIFVSSEAHRNPTEIDWQSFGKFEPYSIGKAMEHYSNNKLLLTTMAVELSRRLNKNGHVNCSVLALCPGPINSNIAREAPKIFHPLMKLVFGIFFKSPAKASVPILYFAASPDFNDIPFDYFFLSTRRPVDEKASDPTNGRRLWEMSEELLSGLGVKFGMGG